ncbi:MAG TPA: extracellular solute-binding protein [Phycisphaerae bacterium]|nr:extracellular solute-binding protein [Phycisphaerae bacterium]
MEPSFVPNESLTRTDSRRAMGRVLLALGFILFGSLFAAPANAQNEVQLWLTLGEREPTIASSELLARVSDRHKGDFIDAQDERDRLVEHQGTILRLVQQFENSYNRERSPDDHIRITIQFISWSRAAFALDWAVKHRGDRPDVVQMPSTWTACYAEQGLLLPIRDLAQDVAAYINYPRASLESCWPADKADTPYALPWSIDCRIYYYNVADFAGAGYSTAAEVKQAFMGLDDLRKACRQVRRLNRPRPVFDLATADDWTIIHDAAPWIWRRGGAYVRLGQKGWESGLADVATREGLFDYIEFAMEFADLPKSPEDARTGAEVDDDFYKRGGASLISTGQWLVRRIRSLPDRGDERFGTVAPCFSDRHLPLTYLGGSHLALVSKDGRTPASLRAARALVTRLTADPELAFEYGYASGYSPALRGTLDRLATKDSLYLAAAEAVNFAQEQHYPSIPQWRDIEEKLKGILHRVWLKAGEYHAMDPMQPDLAVKKARREINQILDDGHFQIEVILKGWPRAFWEKWGGRILLGLAFVFMILVGVLFWLWRFQPCQRPPVGTTGTSGRPSRESGASTAG